MKFQEILIHAKKLGLTWDAIMTAFSPTSDSSATISKKDFALGLEKLNADAVPLTRVRNRVSSFGGWRHIFFNPTTCPQVNVERLVEMFGTGKGNQISLNGIKTFALAIPHVAWKAERTRRLSSTLGPSMGGSQVRRAWSW